MYSLHALIFFKEVKIWTKWCTQNFQWFLVGNYCRHWCTSESFNQQEVIIVITILLKMDSIKFSSCFAFTDVLWRCLTCSVSTSVLLISIRGLTLRNNLIKCQSVLPFVICGSILAKWDLVCVTIENNNSFRRTLCHRILLFTFVNKFEGLAISSMICNENTKYKHSKLLRCI